MAKHNRSIFTDMYTYFPLIYSTIETPFPYTQRASEHIFHLLQSKKIIANYYAKISILSMWQLKIYAFTLLISFFLNLLTVI